MEKRVYHCEFPDCRKHWLRLERGIKVCQAHQVQLAEGRDLPEPIAARLRTPKEAAHE